MSEIHHGTHTPELLHPRLIGPSAVFLMAAFATDLLYYWTRSSQWETFSIWLITAGLTLAALAGLSFLAEVALRGVRAIAWWRFAVMTVAALLSVLNAFIHSRDGYTAVVPQGLELSALVTVLLLALGWHGWSLAAVRRAHSSQNLGALARDQE